MSKSAIRRNRGVLLPLWLILLGAIGVYGIYTSLQTQFPALGLTTAAFVVICALAMWKWQRWGYYGIVGAFAIVAGVVLVTMITGASDNPLPLILSLGIVAITVALVQPRIAAFR